MSSIKLILRKSKERKDGTCPIALRIIKDRKPSYIHTGIYMLPKHWDKDRSEVRRSHPNSNRVKAALTKKLTEAYAAVLDADTNDGTVTTSQIKRKITKKKGHASFTEYAERRIREKHEQGVFSVSKAERSILNNILGFHSSKTLTFQEIDTAFINRFKVHCTSKLGQSTRTRTNQLIFIRTLFNQAIGEGNVDPKYYPFAGDKEKIRLTSGQKIGLGKEEISAIEALVIEPQTSMWHTRNVWLFAFYFAGIRISDVIKLKWTDFQDGRLFYVMNKNEKPLSLKVPDKALAILDLYISSKELKGGHVFPFLQGVDMSNKHEVFSKSRNATRLMNKYLKRIAIQCGIDKNLSNHIARHSFGNLAGDQIHPLMLQKLYRHSDLKTTLNYQANFIHKDADAALDKVVDF